MGDILFWVGVVGAVLSLVGTIVIVLSNKTDKFIYGIGSIVVFGLLTIGGLALKPETTEDGIEVEDAQELQLDEEVDEAEDKNEE